MPSATPPFAGIFRLALPLLLMTALAGCAAGTAPAPSRIEPGLTVRVETTRKDLGLQRSFLLHAPASPVWDGRSPLPVVVALHGAFMTAAEMEQRSGLSRLADEKGFAVIYPEGLGLLGYLQHWNAGFCCGKAAKDAVDDLGFIDVCLSEAMRRLPLDKGRIHIAGLSNGGMLALHYGLNGRHQPAGILAVAAALPETLPAYPAGRAVPVMLVHGFDDTHIPYTGGAFKGRDDGPRFAGQEQAAAWWAAGMGCSASIMERESHHGAVRILEWQHAATPPGVLLYELTDFGHDWPSEESAKDLQDEQGQGFDAGRVYWELFGR